MNKISLVFSSFWKSSSHCLICSFLFFFFFLLPFSCSFLHCCRRLSQRKFSETHHFTIFQHYFYTWSPGSPTKYLVVFFDSPWKDSEKRWLIEKWKTTLSRDTQSISKSFRVKFLNPMLFPFHVQKPHGNLIHLLVQQEACCDKGSR